MKPIPTIEVCHVIPLARFLDKHGVDSNQYLVQSHIPKELLKYPFYRISKRQYFKLHNLIAADHSLSGIIDRAGGFYDNSDLEAASPILQQAPTLICLIRQYAQFLKRSADFGTLSLSPDSVDSTQVWLQYCAQKDGLDPARGVVWQIHLTSLLRIIRFCSSSDWLPKHIAVQKDQLESIRLPAELRNQSVKSIRSGVAICFPKEWLWKYPRISISEEVRKTNQSICSEQIHNQPESFSSSLYTILESQLRAVQYCPTYEEAAEICNFSTRSLNRMLHQEGTNYRELVGAARYNRAKVLLETEPLMKVETISYLLGYQQLPAFVRAFKSMAGVSPSRYRSQIANSALTKHPIHLTENKTHNPKAKTQAIKNKP